MSNIKTLMTPLALLLLAASGASYAMQTTLTVKGSIIPPSCTPSLSNGGKLDFGSISLNQLNSNANTTLDGQDITFSINCSGPTKVGFTATDNRVGSSNDPKRFGLGLDNSGNKIGHFRIIPDNEATTVNGKDTRLGQTFDGSKVSSATVIHPYSDNGQTVLWHVDRNGGETTVAAVPNVTTASTTFLVTPDIYPTNTLDLANDVNLDGNVTFTVVYL